MAKGLIDAMNHFRPCFTRERPFEWFEVVITGFLIRDDEKGLASIMRAFSIQDHRYGALAHFFESDAYDTKAVEQKWIDFVAGKGTFPTVAGRLVLLGDHTKSIHSGKYMPGVEKMANYSQNTIEAYVFAQLLGYAGIVFDNGSSLQCLPLASRIQNALGAMKEWLPPQESAKSVLNKPNTVQMLYLLHGVSQQLPKTIDALDRAFLCEKLLEELDALNEEAGEDHMVIVTRAKKNVVGYNPLPTPEESAPKKRGRPRKNPVGIKINELFDDPSIKFKSTVIERYGKKVETEYYCIDLLWGSNIQRKLRFVLTRTELKKEEGKKTAILVSTDLTLTPEDIILTYFLRWAVETMFRDLKSEMGMCSYRFWTRSIEELDRKNKVDRLAAVTDVNQQKAIMTTVEKYERYVLFTNIAYGVITMLCADPVISKEILSHIYQRTRRHSERATIAAARSYMRKWHFLISIRRESEGLSRFIDHLMAS